MTSAASLYIGRTIHARLSPFRHRFSYRLASLLIDVDRLEEAHAQCRFFSVERFNVFSFHRADHGPCERAPLRPWAEATLEQASVRLDGGPIRLLCLPRLLGYVFNPISVWFGHGPDGDLRGVIYEVHNTFGDRHAYAAPTPGSGAARQSAAKVFHVSPFFPTDGSYAFQLRAPDERYALAIRYTRGDDAVFTASHAAERAPLTDAALARVFFGQPALTAKVIAGIHWEALRIMMKGGRYHPRPEPPAPVSVARLADAAAPIGVDQNLSYCPQ